jgi:energy-coupling factor transport system permease protein
MIGNVTIGQYYPGNTVIHRLDPRLKILATFLFIVSLFIVNQFAAYALVIAYLGASIILSKVPVKFILKGLRPILMIIILTFVLNMILTPGEARFSIFGKLTVTKEGFRQASFMAIRLTLLITGTSLLTLTTPPIQLTDGIEKLLNPFRKIGVPAHELAMMMTIALRFIPTLMEETNKIMKAQMARGGDFESGNLIQRAKSLVPLLVPLFISAFRRADELAMAMEARCYRGGEGRTRLKVLRYQRRDLVTGVISLAYLALLIWSRTW